MATRRLRLCIRTTLDKHKTTYKLQKNVKGNGIAAVAAAIPVYRDRREQKRAWRVLLDSGLDGDLIFIKSADVESINPRKRTHSIVWGTSTGDFQTKKLVVLSLSSQTFLQNKPFSVKPDTVRLYKNAPNPTFDMILGIETLRNFGVILNFAECSITIDHHEILMRPLDAFSSLSTHRQILKRETHNIHHSTKFPGAPTHLRSLPQLLKQLTGP